MHIIDVGLLLNPKMKQVHLKLLLCLVLAITATGQLSSANLMGQMGGQQLGLGQSSFSSLGGFSGMGAFGQQSAASPQASGFGQFGSGFSQFGQQPAASQFGAGFSQFGQQPAASQFGAGFSQFGQQPATSQFTATVPQSNSAPAATDPAITTGTQQQPSSDVSVPATGSTNNNPNSTCNNIIDLDFPLFSDTCSVLPQTIYSLPNFFGHQTKQQLNAGLATLKPAVSSSCFQKMRLFVCPLFFPPCDEKPVLPCTSFCRAVKKRCAAVDLSMINCDQLPETSEFCPSITDKNIVNAAGMIDPGSSRSNTPQPPFRRSPMNTEPSAITIRDPNRGESPNPEKFTFVGDLVPKSNVNNNGDSDNGPSNNYGGGSSYTSSNSYGSGSSYTPSNSYGAPPPPPPPPSNNYGGSSYTPSNNYGAPPPPPPPPSNNYGGSSYTPSNSYGAPPPPPPPPSNNYGGSSYTPSSTYSTTPPPPPPPPSNYYGGSSYKPSNSYGAPPPPPPPPSNNYGGSSYTPSTYTTTPPPPPPPPPSNYYGGSSYTPSTYTTTPPPPPPPPPSNYYGGSSYTPSNSYSTTPPPPPSNYYGGGSSYTSSNKYGGGSSYTPSNSYSTTTPPPPSNYYDGGSSYTPTKRYVSGSSYTPSSSYGGSSYTPTKNYGSASSYTPSNSYGGSSYTPSNSYGGSSYTPSNSYGGSYAAEPTGPPFGIQSTGSYSNYYPEKPDLSKCGPQPPAYNPCTPYGAQFYPLPGYPECYIQCVFNRPVVKPCPNLLVWNARINVCDWPTIAENGYSGSGYGSSSYSDNNNNYGSSSYGTPSPSPSSYSYGRKKRSTKERKKRFGGYNEPIFSEVPLGPPIPGITPLPGFFGPIGIPGPLLPFPPLAPFPPVPPVLPLPPFPPVPLLPPFPPVPGILPPFPPGFIPPVPPIPPFGPFPPFGPIPPIGPIPPPILPPFPLPPFMPPIVPPLPIPLGGPLLPPLPMSLPATFIPGPPPIFGPSFFGPFGGPLDPFGLGFGPMGLPFGDPFFADPFGPGFGFGGGYPFGDDFYGYDDYDKYGSKYGYKDNYKGGYNGGYSKNGYGNSNYGDDYGYSKSKYGNNNYNSYGSNNYDNGYSSNKNYKNNGYYSDYRKKREYGSDVVDQATPFSLINQQQQIPQSVKISYNSMQSPLSYDSINQQQLSARVLPNTLVQSQVQYPSQEISQPLIQPSPCVGKITPLNVPHPSDPTKYISCLNEQKYEIMECPGGLIYNPSNDQCEKVKNVESICEREKPCLNDGQCYKTSSTTFKCSCRGPWTGERCETPLSSCALNPCGEGNECHTLKTTDYRQDYVCVCDKQRSYGLSCERNTVPNPCVSASNQGEEYYAFAFSAHAYVQCNGIIPYIRPCALGLYWNQEMKICDRQETAPARPAEDQPQSYQIQYNSKSYNRPIVSVTDQNVDRQQGFRYRNYNPNVLSNDQSKTYNQINSRSETPIINSYTSLLPFKSIRRFQNPSQYIQTTNQQPIIGDQQYGQLLNQKPQLFQGTGQRSIVESSKPSSSWVVDNSNTQPTVTASSSYRR